MSGEMDLYPGRYEFDFEDLKATEGYNPPDDFLVRELPLDAGGALPGRPKKRELLWYEYPNPFEPDDSDRELQEEMERQLQLEEERLLRSLEEMERKGQQLEANMLQRRLAEEERRRQYKDEKQRRRQQQQQYQQRSQRQHQAWNQQRLVERELVEREEQHLAVQQQRLDAMRLRRPRLRRLEVMRLRRLEAMHRLDCVQRQNLAIMRSNHLDRRQWQRLEYDLHHLHEEQDALYFEEMWANPSASECWGPDDQTSTYSSSPPARNAHEEHQVHVEEHQFHVNEHQVHVKMCEYDDASIPRYCLFKSEANTQELLLGFPLKIPYYIYAGRCNLNVKGYELRYADFFPDFHSWNFNWVCPTTYDGDSQFVDFFAELMGQAEYVNTKDRVLAKAIAIANKGFQKILYFQIELAVADCMMLLEDEEKFEQRYNLYSHIAYEICFKKKKYESVLASIMNGHEGLRYELTELGSDANEDDALEMREFVDHLVRSTPIEQPSPTSSDDYKEWVSKKIDLQFISRFHLYVDYLVEKINMAQDLDLAPKDMK